MTIAIAAVLPFTAENDGEPAAPQKPRPPRRHAAPQRRRPPSKRDRQQKSARGAPRDRCGAKDARRVAKAKPARQKGNFVKKKAAEVARSKGH